MEGQLSIRTSKLALWDSPGAEEGKQDGRAEESTIEGAMLRMLRVRELDGEIERNVEGF